MDEIRQIMKWLERIDKHAHNMTNIQIIMNNDKINVTIDIKEV
jgi:hypothetical protein